MLLLFVIYLRTLDLFPFSISLFQFFKKATVLEVIAKVIVTFLENEKYAWAALSKWDI